MDAQLVKKNTRIKGHAGRYQGRGGLECLIEGLVRLLPGVLGNPDSIETESFGGGDFLEGPQYTRPPIYRGLEVPEVLRSGNHAVIDKWRRDHALARTRERRPDLFERSEK